jgi:hypothetical protein
LAAASHVTQNAIWRRWGDAGAGGYEIPQILRVESRAHWQPGKKRFDPMSGFAFDTLQMRGLRVVAQV